MSRDSPPPPPVRVCVCDRGVCVCDRGVCMCDRGVCMCVCDRGVAMSACVVSRLLGPAIGREREHNEHYLQGSPPPPPFYLKICKLCSKCEAVLLVQNV